MRYSLSAIRFATLWILLFSQASLHAQVSGILKGPAGQPISGADVFINRTTLLSTTNEFGEFKLENVPSGFLEIVAYKKGFALYRAPMRIQEERTYSLNLQLSAAVKAKGKGIEADLATFSHNLIGEDGLITFQNERQLNVEHREGKFRVLSGPVVIEYPNAGYRITCYFSSAEFLAISDAAYCYQEYQGADVNQNIAFEKTRMALFRGSLRHLLMALSAGKSTEEGYTIEDHAGQGVDGLTLAIPSSVPGYFRLKAEQPLKVNYQGQASTIQGNAALDFNKLGVLINPKAAIVTGSMGKGGLPYQLPQDYLPISADVESTFAEALNYFYEKVYVHTDKPYYYLGEPLWFKAYVNYFKHEWRDTLSDVLYVELIGKEKEVLLQRTVRIEHGMGHGNFILPDSLPEGTWYLRAYTALQRNFGDDHLFIKAIPVLDVMSKVDPTFPYTPPAQQSIVISPDKNVYKTRDRITLSFTLKDSIEKSHPTNLSVSVTDAAQVIPVPESKTILSEYKIEPAKIKKIDELKHRIERGVSFYAQFQNDKGKGEKAQLTFIQWKTGDVLSAETNEDGQFWQTGLQFTDSAMFSYKSDKAKKRAYGSVKIFPREIPPVQAPQAPDIPIIKVGSLQRMISEYEVPKDSKLLDVVEIKASRINQDEADRAKRRTYGKADHTITSKTLNAGSGDILFALAGKVPGLVVSPTQGIVYFTRALANSITAPPYPMVTVNDTPISGDPGTILRSLDINTIESIEFTARLNVLYGALGANGVIAVYTKSGTSVDNTDPNFQIVKLPGFSRARVFQAPDYSVFQPNNSQTDFRATLCWEPNVVTDKATGKATVSFYGADLPGKYRVVVEGVAADGRPVRGEVFLTIEEKN